MLNVETFKGGFDSNFSYLVWDPQSKEAAILDACIEPGPMLKKAQEEGLNLKFVFLMHSHADHLVGLDVYKQNNIPLYAHESIKADADMRLKDNDTIQLGDLELTVMHTPGHCPDCVIIYGDNKVFTSDTIFVGGCGRCDLPGSNAEQQWESMQRFKQLPDGTVVYPGHDYGSTPTSTVKREKAENRFLICASKQEFLDKRL